jgi:transglutaminase-like putative cysteine protease
MQKKSIVRILTVSIAVFLIFSFTVVDTHALDNIDLNDADSGYVGINYDKYNKAAVLIQHDDQKYYYMLKDSNTQLPLQLGNGEYKISIYENVSGNKYKPVISREIEISTKLEKVFTNSIQNIDFNSDMLAIKYANFLVKDAKTDQQKVEMLYNYVINNIKYDYKKAESVKSGYLPIIDDTIIAKKGICYDYASLFAAMVRSQGIPTKLVTGYTENNEVYHAWNEVYINNQWITVDTTFDSVTGDNTMKQNSSNYQVVKVY